MNQKKFYFNKSVLLKTKKHLSFATIFDFVWYISKILCLFLMYIFANYFSFPIKILQYKD